MTTSAGLEIDAQYRQLREEWGWLDRPGRGRLRIAGADAAEYLQSQVTNEVEAIPVGESVYAALLDRKARVQADMRILRLDETEFLLDVEAPALPAAARHLDMYKIGREVSVEDISAELHSVWVIGPALEFNLELKPGTDGGHEVGEAWSIELRALDAPIGDLPGVELFFAAADGDKVRAALTEAGAPPVEEAAVEILRIEAGLPRFGFEISPEVMPAEAGIVERAINFEKGCYIGQEPVARLHYRGRPNRQLRRLALSGPVPPGSELRLGEKAVGTLTSSAVSPARGPLGLAIVRREAEPGSRVSVVDSEVEAVVESVTEAPPT